MSCGKPRLKVAPLWWACIFANHSLNSFERDKIRQPFNSFSYHMKCNLFSGKIENPDRSINTCSRPKLESVFVTMQFNFSISISSIMLKIRAFKRR